MVPIPDRIMLDDKVILCYTLNLPGLRGLFIRLRELKMASDPRFWRVCTAANDEKWTMADVELNLTTWIGKFDKEWYKQYLVPYQRAEWAKVLAKRAVSKRSANARVVE
jgi:hypothetical protein